MVGGTCVLVPGLLVLSKGSNDMRSLETKYHGAAPGGVTLGLGPGGVLLSGEF
jgi:hypothetical protein